MHKRVPYDSVDPEPALKYAVQQFRDGRAELIEGLIGQRRPAWAEEAAVASIRDQIEPAVRHLGCMSGSGDLDLPGSNNWYVPDLAVVPRDLAEGAGALLPAQTLLVVEVDTDYPDSPERVAKRGRYAEYGAPLYLLVDRQERACTLFAKPGPLGYTSVDGPHPFGTPIGLPEPFGLTLDTTDF